ncbi:MAG TPA: tyrosine-protein phosphatase [Bryobacteraceae bacterium]|nr:tyrosine-protein phosphatase [Bryobacteraceae bacterium]
MKSVNLGGIAVLAASFVVSAAYAAEAQMQAPGVPNFHQINDHVYRGAQPTSQGWESLSKLGVKVVLDLRRDGENGEHSIAAESRAVTAAGMRYVNIPMNGIVAPRDADISKALEIFNGPDPVFVHCKLGKDRTGTVVACYRISHDGWENRKAMDEAKSIGLHRIEFGMKRYIAAFQSLGAAPLAVAVP